MPAQLRLTRPACEITDPPSRNTTGRAAEKSIPCSKRDEPCGAANAALMLATAGLASAYAKQGVRVVGLNPGLTKTERVAEGLRADAALRGTSEQEALQQSLSRRDGRA